MAVAPNAQELIKKYIQNKSAFIKSSTDLILQLKKSKGNPTAVNAVGAQNLAMMLANIFSRFFATEPKNLKGNCRTIKAQLIAKLEALEQQLKTNKDQFQATDEDDVIVELIQQIKAKIEKLNCDIIDPNGREPDDTPIT